MLSAQKEARLPLGLRDLAEPPALSASKRTTYRPGHVVQALVL